MSTRIPKRVYVADFLGVSNVMDSQSHGGGRVMIGEFEMTAGKGDPASSGRVKLVIRPERVVIHPQGETGPNRLPAMVERVVYVGPVLQVILRLAPGEPLQALVTNQGENLAYEQGSPVTVELPSEALRALRGSEGDTADAPDKTGEGEATMPTPVQTQAS